MSDVTTDTMMHSVAAGIAVDIAEEGFDRVSAILSGIPGGANRAVGSALARAAAAGKTVAKRAVTQEYAISSSEFTNRTKNVNNIQRASSGEVSINFGYRGSVIPLRVFDTKVDRSGRVVTRVKKSSARQRWTTLSRRKWVLIMVSTRGRAKKDSRLRSFSARLPRR